MLRRALPDFGSVEDGESYIASQVQFRADQLHFSVIRVSGFGIVESSVLALHVTETCEAPSAFKAAQRSLTQVLVRIMNIGYWSARSFASGGLRESFFRNSGTRGRSRARNCLQPSPVLELLRKWAVVDFVPVKAHDFNRFQQLSISSPQQYKEK